MNTLKSETPKATEIQDNSVLPDANDFEHNVTQPEASTSSTLPDAGEISQSDRLQRPPQIGEGSDLSYLPNASEADTSIAEAQDISMSTHRSHSNLSDAAEQDDDTVLPEEKSSFVSTENEDTTDLPYRSDPDDSDYHESDVSTSTFIYKNHKAEADSAALPAAEDPDVGKVSTPEGRPVIDDYSNLSDAFDANVDSGSFDARPLASTPTRQQISLLRREPLHRYSTSSDIKMAESSAAGTLAVESAPASAPESAVESSIVGSSTVGSSGDVTVTPSEDVKPSKISSTLTEMTLLTTFSTMTDNLFFVQDDGTVLAVRIEPAAGPHLLRGFCALSQPTGSPSQLSGLPFAATAARNLDDALANEAQNDTSSSRASTRLPSAPVRSKKASTSIKASASVRSTSAATSSTSSPTPSTVAPGRVAQMDAVFASAEGNPYDRDWISNHGLNEEVLTEIPNSKHKLDLLVRHGAVVAGDKLCVTYHSNGSPVVIEGEVSSPNNHALK